MTLRLIFKIPNTSCIHLTMDSKKSPRFECKSCYLHWRLKELVRGPEAQEEEIQQIRTMTKPLRCLACNPNTYLQT